MKETKETVIEVGQLGQLLHHIVHPGLGRRHGRAQVVEHSSQKSNKLFFFLEMKKVNYRGVLLGLVVQFATNLMGHVPEGP